MTTKAATGKRKAAAQVPGQATAPAPAAEAAQPVAAAGPAGADPAQPAVVQEPAPQPAPAADDGLPDQDDIDRSKISRSVLTKQGWVLPIDKPGPQFAKG